MKKFLCVFTILIMMVSTLAGCGNKGKESNNNEQSSSNPAQSSANDTSKNSGTDVKVNMGTSGTNLSLPEGYPKDIVPLLDDANIINVIDNKESMAMGITYTTQKSFDDAVAFYQQVVKDAAERTESKSDNGYLLFGRKNDIDISIVVSKYEGEKVSVLLNIGMVDKKANDSTSSSETNYFDDAKTVDLPENYPKDKLPVISDDKVTEASLTESDSGNSYYLIVASKKKIKDIVEYYEQSWGKMENKYKNIGSQDFQLQGDIEKYTITISGTIQDEKNQVVEYHISIEESKE